MLLTPRCSGGVPCYSAGRSAISWEFGYLAIYVQYMLKGNLKYVCYVLYGTSISIRVVDLARQRGSWNPARVMMNGQPILDVSTDV